MLKRSHRRSYAVTAEKMYRRGSKISPAGEMRGLIFLPKWLSNHPLA
jgi:hypothetical protein